MNFTWTGLHVPVAGAAATTDGNMTSNKAIPLQSSEPSERIDMVVLSPKSPGRGGILVGQQARRHWR